MTIFEHLTGFFFVDYFKRGAEIKPDVCDNYSMCHTENVIKTICNIEEFLKGDEFLSSLETRVYFLKSEIAEHINEDEFITKAEELGQVATDLNNIPREKNIKYLTKIFFKE